MRTSDDTRPGGRAAPLGLAGLVAVAVVAATSATAFAGGHHDPKDPAPRPPASELVLEHVDLVQVGRGDGGGVATASVRNADDAPADDVTVAYELGDGTTFDRTRSTSGCTAPDTLVVCPVGDLAPGASAEVAIGVRVPATTAVGSIRRGVFRQPRSAGWDPAAGEWMGVEGTWRTRFTALADGSVAVCALDLPDDAEVRVGRAGDDDGAGERILRVRWGTTTSRAVAVEDGVEYEIEVRLPDGPAPAPEGTPIERWDAVGLVAADQQCGPDSAGALGVTGRWRARSAVELVVAPGARLVVTGAVWGTGPAGRTASVAVRNLGPDPAPARIDLLGTRARGGTAPCRVGSDAGSGGEVAATCSVEEITPGSIATVAIGVMDGADLGRWVATLPPTSAIPAASSSQERP